MTLIIPSRYCGPASSANGGWMAGSLAALLSDGRADAGGVRVDLRQPPPLDSTMLVESPDGPTEPGRRPRHLRASFGGAVIAEATRLGSAPEDEGNDDDQEGDQPASPVTGADPVEIEPLDAVSYEDAVHASETFPGRHQHPFRTCFGCGDRPDGLRIFPGPLDPSAASDDPHRRYAAPWTPQPEPEGETPVAGTEEEVPRVGLPTMWAALDCVGGWAGGFGIGRTMVLARMTACIDALPVIGERHVVLGGHLGTEGRKTRTVSTVLDADGRVAGVAEHLWIAVDPERFSA